MKLNWTKADHRRALKMGWDLNVDWIVRYGDRFKTDAEAARWVCDNAATPHLNWPTVNEKTCRKAVLLCCGGGR